MVEVHILLYLFGAALLWKMFVGLKRKDVLFGSYVGGGGGYPPTPEQPSPQEEARARILEMQEQARIDAENRAREEREKQRIEAEKRRTFQSSLKGAYNQAQTYGQSRLNSLGINDTYGIMDTYLNELNRAKSSIPDLDPNPGSYFTPTLFDNALSSERNQERTKLGNTYDEFAGDGFDLNYFGDTADDSVINAIIDQQYGDTNTFLDRARDRGQLDSSAYDYALSQLGNSRSGAVSRANDMGLGVLQKDRDLLKGIANEGRSKITNWDFGSKFDPGAYKTRIQSTANDYLGRLEGDIRNNFGSTKFFDPNSLITAAGAFRGQTNTGAPSASVSPLLSALQDDETKKRGAGSQGAF